MKILVLNSGSSSIKFQLLDTSTATPLASGLLEQIGEAKSHEKIKFVAKDGKEHFIEYNDTIKNHKDGIDLVARILKESGLLEDFSTLDGIGHRVVHGGEIFKKAEVIDSKTIESIKLLSPLAPLHNPANIIGIEVSLRKAPNVPNVAVFDTAFHQSIPKEAYIYPLPYEWYERYALRRYGFHGTSHKFVAKEAAKLLGRELEDTNLITLHLGNGASVCAIKGGKSVDTSMGLTPLEGLMMGTRSGDIDPAIHYYMHKKIGIEFEELDDVLNKRSGLKGICGVNDLREIISASKNGDERAKLALSMFSYRIKKYIGAYSVVLGRVDAIIFTGGIGENAEVVREMACEGLDESIGAILDRELNSTKTQGVRFINRDNSKIKIAIIPTNEELEIAMQTKEAIEMKAL